MTNQPLRDRIALVTGAGRGLGRELATAYAAAGASVICTARTRSQLDQTVATIEAAGGSAWAHACDATHETQVEEFFDAVAAKHDRLDIVFLNAGGTEGEELPIADSDFTAWKRIVDMNLSTAFLMGRGSLPLLRQGTDPKIVTMGSGLGRAPRIGASAYGCGKAALSLFTQALAMELLPEGITVNELIPGPVGTAPDSFEPHYVKDGVFKGEYFKTPADIIPLAMFLATQPSHGPSGQTFALNRRLL
jgi:3-oxoacyl-[acyl-carrier protein] reductase